jgi:SMI1 / KNR4 family (SUKH-1)
MIPSNRKWSQREPASVEAIAGLNAVANVPLPTEYLQLLAFSNGGEGPLAVQPWNFCLDSAEEATKYQSERTFEEFFPGFFVFGGNGAGELLALDLRGAAPWPVVAIDSTNCDLSESVLRVAKDFGVFLSLVGVEKEND